jgi:hypothetical protein
VREALGERGIVRQVDVSGVNSVSAHARLPRRLVFPRDQSRPHEGWGRRLEQLGTQAGAREAHDWRHRTFAVSR